jgi:hypothetical protein
LEQRIKIQRRAAATPIDSLISFIDAYARMGHRAWTTQVEDPIFTVRAVVEATQEGSARAVTGLVHEG